MTRISIALCVCNGARFLGEQLSSLCAQRRLPDEVVVGDDASDDDSVAIIEKFSAEAPFPVRLIRNSSRLGVRGNFQKVIAHCVHDLIALCDQDDVWLPEKLAVLASRTWE
jgi:glycosyltransferase involved in cell wall biosynthesis